MLATGWRCAILALTNNGKTKSCALSFVSRTRLRKEEDRRSRRGLCTSFRTERE
jgi:hypothetical protein